MRILVAGGGAVGGVVAEMFLSGGADVTISDTDRGHVQVVRGEGLRVRDGEERRLEGAAMVEPQGLEGLFDVVFLAVKAPDTGDALRSISPHMHKDTFFISLQGGYLLDYISEMVEESRTMGGVATFISRKRGPGEVEVLSPGRLIVGELDGSDSPRLRELKELLPREKGPLFETTGNIQGHLWAHLHVSASLGTLGALLGSVTGEVVSQEALAEVISPLWSEVYGLTQKLELDLEDIEEGLEPANLAVDAGTLSARLENIVRGSLLWREAEAYSASMIADLKSGRRTEVDFINGYILQKGRKAGIKTPFNYILLSLVKEMERGERIPGMNNLGELRRRFEEERSMGLM